MKCQSGFTLVELLVGALVMLIVVGALAVTTRVTFSLRNMTQDGLDLQQNVRSALNFICLELVNAGAGMPYVTKINGIPATVVPSGALIGPLGAAVSSSTVNFITPCNGTGQQVTRDGEGNMLSPIIHTDMLAFLGGMGDSRFVKQDLPGPTTDYGTQVILENNSIFRAGQVVVITNGFQVALGQITQVLSNGGLQFSTGQDTLGLNTAGNSSNPSPNYYAATQIPGGPPPQVIPLSSITYFVDATTNPAHPALKRLANSAAGPSAATTVADDIEDFRVAYLVDDDANATTAAIPLESPTLDQVPLIRGATITVTGRSRGRMNDFAYADKHSRLTMSQTVFFRNNIRR